MKPEEATLILSNMIHDDEAVYGRKDKKRNIALAMAIEALKGRLHGEWIEKHCDYGVYYRCSNCHKMPPNYECDYKEGAIKTNFCPNCGADMRKEGEAE